MLYKVSPLCQVWWSKANDQRKSMSSNLDLFLSKEQKQDSRRKLQFFFLPNVSKMFIDHRDQQIVCRKARNFELCFGTNAGTNQAKIEKIWISPAIWLWILRSLASATRCEANKNIQLREERPIGSYAVKMMRDLRRRAVSRTDDAQHVAAANARAEGRAGLHNWSIWCQGSSRTIDCLMVHSKTRNVRRGNSR